MTKIDPLMTAQKDRWIDTQPPKGDKMPFNDKKGPLYIAVRAVVCADFEAASKRFYETLGGQDSWAPMEEAMWALQALHNVEIVNELEPVGVVQWTKTLAARHRTKREA